MARPSLLLRLSAAYLAVLVVSALLVDDSLRRTARANALASQERSLATAAALLGDLSAPVLADAERGPRELQLQERVRALAAAGPVQLTVIRADGRVVADSSGHPEAMDNHATRPEVLEALAGARGVDERFSSAHGKRLHFVAVPIELDGRVVGVARATEDLGQIEAGLRRVSKIVLTATLVAAALGLGAAVYFARRLSSSLEDMAVAAEAIAEGNYQASRPGGDTHELARLAGALDVTATKLSQRMVSIEADRNKVLAILGSMVEGVIAVDRSERVVHMNEVAGNLLRVVPAQAVGRPIWEVVRVVEVCEILDTARREAREVRGEARLTALGSAGSAVSPAAAARVIELRSSPLRDASNESAGAVVVLHDVTELRRLESVRRDFVANVSHELKTPLTAIRGLVETLLDEDELDVTTRRRFLGKIRDQSGRLGALVTDLLALARAESQVVPTELRAIDLRVALGDCAQRFASVCADKGLRLSLRVPPEPLLAWAEEEALRQILDNLTDNAIKYTPRGGEVWIEGSTGEAGEALIEVRDTGIGIEPRDQERIFERFYRVDKARSRELGGTGLGLSIVRHLALSLDGKVAVESSPGSGSRFSVELRAVTGPE
jgi:two-component system, OmpR family, phosphate regulon sensor histidine kinase PhoR